MKIYLILTAILAVFLLLFPLACVTVKNSMTIPTVQITSMQKEEETDAADTSQSEESVAVLLTSSHEVIHLEVFDYLVGAVAGEMPASFHPQALRAQAVACYTYLRWIQCNGDNNEYDITDDPTQNQSYLSRRELQEKWGEKYSLYIQKIEEAVNEVDGEYLSYENEPVLALFHGLSGGMTESAKNAWGRDIPYLQSVAAPGDALSPDVDSEVSFTTEEIKKLLAPGEGKEPIGKTESTDTGFVTTFEFYGKSYTGREVASALKLKSPFFTAEYQEGRFLFRVRGKGHGLGMSQYSADYIARQGSSYREILSHFYPGTELTK